MTSTGSFLIKGLGLFGGAVMAFSVFLPWWGASISHPRIIELLTTSVEIALSRGYGIAGLLLAVGGIVLIRSGSRLSSLCGIVALFDALYASRLLLHRAGPTFRVEPKVGLYLYIVGALLLSIGGFLLPRKERGRV